MPIMKILIGLPCSGKSTYSNTFTDYSRISRNKNRLQLFGDSSYLGDEKLVNLAIELDLKKAFADQVNIVVDNTNLKREYRKYYIKQAIENNYELEFVIFECDELTLQKQAQQRNFDFAIIEKMKSKYQHFRINEVLDYPYSIERI